MTGWIMSIVGMVLTVTMTEIMLPEGQTAKYIKGVISLMVVYVVIAPIPSLIRSKIDINSFFDFSSGSYESDQAFIQIIKEDKQSALSQQMERIYHANGFTQAKASVLLNEKSEVVGVIVSVKGEDVDAVYNLTKQYLGVKEEQIVINEICT
ncbi:MAG TPA: hypothetical protein DIC18_02790 [Clostridiales bacterium]|nr:hypothetical protein [Clostridiales bacterium]HCU56244.1 hypothetical protein [Clostridiales bacterium]